MARRPIRGSRVVITGASSGIGEALARQLAQQGARLLLTARRADRLSTMVQELHSFGAEAEFVAGDITDSAVRGELIEHARRHFSGLDVLVNNAGVGGLGPFAESDKERLRRIMEVNFFAPIELTRLALPLLRQGNRPLIVNVGSVLGHRAVPRKSEYCASKFALHGFSDALRAELAPHNIDVLLVSPSTTDSEFFDNALSKESSANRSWGRMAPALVARKTIAAMQSGRHEIILSLGGKLLVWLDRLFPGITDRMLEES